MNPSWQLIICKMKFKINKRLVSMHSKNTYTACTGIFWIVQAIKKVTKEVNINKEPLFFSDKYVFAKTTTVNFSVQTYRSYLESWRKFCLLYQKTFFPKGHFYYLMPSSRILSLIRFIKIKSSSLSSVEKEKKLDF